MTNPNKPKSKLMFDESPTKTIKIVRADGRREDVKVKAWISGAQNVCGYGINRSFAAADLLFEKGVHREAIINFLRQNNLSIEGIDDFLLRKKTEISIINTPTKNIEMPPKPEK